MIRTISVFLFVLFVVPALSQIPLDTQVQIVKAEDARRYDDTLEKLLKSPDVAVRNRAAVAAGRIGDERAVPALTALIFDISGMDAAFALGEIESIKAADAMLPILARLYDPKAEGEHPSGRVSARLIEAAGKIAAANATDPKAKELGKAILAIANRATEREAILPSLTALLRARPAGAEETVRKFLASPDPDTVANALNTLARLRAKNANRDARDLLATHTNAVVRANAARVLGAAEDKEAVALLSKAATSDSDMRVRVSAIRSLAAVKDAGVAAKLVDRGRSLLAEWKLAKPAARVQKSELLEIAAALGKLLAGTNDAAAVKFLDELRFADHYVSAETEIAFAQVSPKGYFAAVPRTTNKDADFWRQVASVVPAMAELGKLPDKGASLDAKEPPEAFLEKAVGPSAAPLPEPYWRALPEILRAYAAFKPKGLEITLRNHLRHPDPIVRATAAELLGEQAVSDENLAALNAAFAFAMINDAQYNDAVLATLDALFKLDKPKSLDAIELAAGSLDQVVRLKVVSLLKDDALKGVELPILLKNLDRDHLTRLRPWGGKGTKLGQVLNTDADYRQALSRKNGTVKAVVTTEKGAFTIDLLPEDAPLTVDNFVKLARSGYFDGVEVHRVVANFVMQDGDQRGDGNGGPGWSIRCEINMVPYERGAVGMALSGKDTGGSQWFVTHSPQPHLDGGYTVFGRVNEIGMKIVDNIVRGDRILSVKIIENSIRSNRG